jgi:hypothetical protein
VAFPDSVLLSIVNVPSLKIAPQNKTRSSSQVVSRPRSYPRAPDPAQSSPCGPLLTSPPIEQMQCHRDASAPADDARTAKPTQNATRGGGSDAYGAQLVTALCTQFIAGV